MAKVSTTHSGNLVRDLPQHAIDNRAGQKDPSQDYRGSHGKEDSGPPPDKSDQKK